MFQEIPVNDEHIIAFKATGKLSHEDYQAFMPRLIAEIEARDCVSVLLALEEFHGWELKAALDDYHFGKTYEKHFKRLAIVGERHWGRWLVMLARPFSRAEIRYFDREQAGEAWDWLREPFDEPAAVPAPTPVGEWRHVLAPTDFSAHAEHALQRAVAIARRYGARLTLLHAVEEALAYGDIYEPMSGGLGYPLVDTEVTRLNMESAQRQLEKLADSLDLPVVQVEVALGSPRDAILSYAEAQQVDVLVMGSHGRRGLARLLGSTTHAVLNDAPCEVLSVPLPPVGDGD